ncbi:MAG: hypothetical protein AMJ84_12700 [Acidithiobacillales bacterium SM23_46]|nr:MAG: hypothetical protein AMJ84_12700 [Acidithiobacillales bacterium SM23_46]
MKHCYLRHTLPLLSGTLFLLTHAVRLVAQLQSEPETGYNPDLVTVCSEINSTVAKRKVLLAGFNGLLDELFKLVLKEGLVCKQREPPLYAPSVE